jgi:hypothetical protein
MYQSSIYLHNNLNIGMMSTIIWGPSKYICFMPRQKMLSSPVEETNNQEMMRYPSPALLTSKLGSTPRLESLLARGANYIDAVVEFCSRPGIEVETMTPNRSEPTGYKVVRVRFKDGRPDGSYEKSFLTGFWISGQHRAEVWGRPAALAVIKDGSLLIADDTGGTIWRVSYTGTRDRATTTGTVPR